jgi:hypothetical protein
MIQYDKDTSYFNVKSKHNWWKNINYTEKPITERLSQTLITFLIF